MKRTKQREQNTDDLLPSPNRSVKKITSMFNHKPTQTPNIDLDMPFIIQQTKEIKAILNNIPHSTKLDKQITTIESQITKLENSRSHNTHAEARLIRSFVTLKAMFDFFIWKVYCNRDVVKE